MGEGAGEIALGDGSGEIFGGDLELTGEPVEIAVAIGKPAYELDFGDVVVHIVSWGGGGGEWFILLVFFECFDDLL